MTDRERPDLLCCDSFRKSGPPVRGGRAARAPRRYDTSGRPVSPCPANALFIGPFCGAQIRDPLTLTDRRSYESGSALCSRGLGTLRFSTVADGSTEMRRAAREELRRGGTRIKVMGSGGVASSALAATGGTRTPG